jgi:hypothetical protein
MSLRSRPTCRPQQANVSTAFTSGYIISKSERCDLPDETEPPARPDGNLPSSGHSTGGNPQHIKATIRSGDSVTTVKDLISAVSQLASWAGSPIEMTDVDDLLEQVT